MIDAVLHNKIPAELKNKEDCLTSTVWGLLKYRPMHSVLSRFLSDAMLYANKEKKLGEILPANYFESHPPKVIFWKNDPEFGQPDILIEAGSFVFVVEDKFHASLSGDDQLQKYGDFLAKHYDKCDRYIVYLTADWDMPAGVRAKGYEKSFYWLSWYGLHSVASELRPNLEPVAKEMSEDLIQYLKHLGFCYFHGFSPSENFEVSAPLFWDDSIPIISKYEVPKVSTKWFWQENI